MMNPQENIVSQFSTLSPELQRAAEFCLQNVNILVVQSMRAFAAQAGVKPATLLRLAQRLGFSGWGELKDAFIDDLGLRNDTYVSKAKKSSLPKIRNRICMRKSFRRIRRIWSSPGVKISRRCREPSRCWMRRTTSISAGFAPASRLPGRCITSTAYSIVGCH